MAGRDQRGTRRRDGRRRPRRRLRRGRRHARRRLPRDRRTAARDSASERCFDTPLAESGIVGTAVGMAMNGMLPVVEMQFDAFAYPGVRADRRATSPRSATAPKGAMRAADGDPHPLRRRHRRRRAPLRLVRGVLRAHPRTDRRRAVDPAGRVLAAARGDPVIPTPSSSSSRRSSTGRRARSTPTVDRDDRRGRGRARRHGRDAARATAPRSPSRSRPPRPPRRRAAACRSSTSARLTPFDDATVMAAVRSTGRAVVDRRGAGLRERRRRDRRPRRRALLLVPRGPGAPGHRFRRAVSRRRSSSTSTCPTSTASSTPSTRSTCRVTR